MAVPSLVAAATAGSVPAAHPQIVLIVMGLFFFFFLIKGTCLPWGKILGLSYDFPYTNGLNKELLEVLFLLPSAASQQR